MRARLIFNPIATTTDHAVRDALAGILGSEVELSVVATRARDHATELARDAVRDGVDAVFALGGDGTANEVLQGVAGTDVALGLLPGGGTNVLARAVGLPNDAHLAATRQLEQLHAGTDHRFGLGEANGRLFGFQAGLGLDAAIVRRVEAHPRWKRYLRQGAFVLLGLREWASNVDRRDPACIVEGVADLPTTPQMLVIAANVDPYTYLGPRALHLVPGARPEAGLSLLTAEAMSTGRVLRALGRAFLDGSHVDTPGFAISHDLSEVTVHTTRPVPLMLDGDHVGDTTSLHLRHRPDAVRMLLPTGADAHAASSPDTESAA